MKLCVLRLFVLGVSVWALPLGCSSGPNAPMSDAGSAEAGAPGVTPGGDAGAPGVTPGGDAGAPGDAGVSGTCTNATVDDGNPCTMDWCDPSSGPVHMPLAAGTACADENVCNGAESCNAEGACAAGTPLVVDDGDVCTTDTCDVKQGVSHAAQPGCDRLPNLGGGRYETRASLLGIVHSADGAAVSGYAVSVLEVPVSGAARSDLTVVAASDGSFRARLTGFPEVVPAHTPPLHALVRITAEGFLRVEREVYLRPGDAKNLGTLVMIPSDSALTMIGPEGGSASDSRNLVTVEIPPGALPSSIPIRITPVQAREQFPFPLPDTTATMYGVVLEPDDAKGHIVRVADATQAGPTGRQTTFTWNGDGQPNTITSHQVLTAFSYDAATGNVSASSDITGTNGWTYDAAGNVASRSDATTSLTYTHDAGNRLTKIVDALGNATTLGYGQGACGCPNGELLTSLHTPDLPTDAQWTYAYNADGLLQTATDPQSATRSFSYNATRDVASTKDALGHETRFSYDQLGRQKSITDPLGRLGVFAYPVPMSGAMNGPSVYAGSPDGQAATTDLDATLTDGQYQVGKNFYPLASFPARVEFYRDATFAFSLGRNYDSNQRLANRGDRVGLPFSGSQILPTTTTASQYREQLFSYINNYDWTSLFQDTESDYIGHYEYEFNNYNADLDVTSDTGWTAVTANYTYTRDNAGRATAVATTFQGLDGTTTESFPGPAASYNYDPTTGRITTLTNGSGTQALAYDARGLLKTLALSFDTGQPTPQAEGTFALSYDPVGRNTRLDYPDGHFRTQSYDRVGRLLSRCYDGYPAPAVARCYTAQYNAVGNPSELTDPEGKSEISYDALDRVTQVWRTPTGGPRTLDEEYSYNALGALSKNIATSVDDKRPLLSGGGTASGGIPATHSGQAVTLDPAGQVTGLDGSTLTFNKRAWLTGLTQAATTESYSYDAQSRRVVRLSTGTTGEYYSYDGANLVAVTNGPGLNIPPAVRRRILYEGVDQALWMYDATIGSSVYFEVDTLGNVRRLRGGKPLSGPALASDFGGYRYTAFGHLNTTDTTTPYPTVAGQRYEQPLRWQSHWFLDVGPGLYDFKARVWSPDLATFLQPDEFGYLTRTGTLWSWPGQNPYRWRDPSGRDAEEWFLRNADNLQAGAEAVSGAALTLATGGLAGELLGLGSLDALGLGAASGAGAIVVDSGAAATTAVVAEAAENQCSAAADGVEAAAAEGAEAGAGALAKSDLNIGVHTAERMAERGVNESMVRVALEKGTPFIDPKNGTINYVLREGFASGKDLLVGTNPLTGKITTVIRGSDLIAPRFVPLISGGPQVVIPWGP